MNEKIIKYRDQRIDNIKGIMIFLTVFAHILLTYKYVEIDNYNFIVKFIYTFHMPVFFIISGSLSKNDNYKRIIKYGYLFLFMHISFILYTYFTSGFIDLFSINYSSWYILLIIVYRLLISFKYIKVILSDKIVFKMTIFLLLLLGFIDSSSLLLTRLFYFFIFFLLGYFYPEYHLIGKKKNYFILIVSLLSLLFISRNTNLEILMGGSCSYIYDWLARILIVFFDMLFYYSLKNIIANKNMLFITKCGYYSLYIYMFHRISTLLISDYFYIYKTFLVDAIIFTFIICFIIVSCSKYLKIIVEAKVFKYTIVIITSLLLVISLTSNNEMTINESIDLDNCISIGFVGDLILLEDQLKYSNNNFDYLFDNMQTFFDDTDYLIGVLEGPVDDDNHYSYGNFDDGKELRLNYPISFLKSIKRAGFDLLNFSNNHILDRGIESYYNTIDNLKKINIDYIGEKNKYKIVEVKGLKLGILAYTYGLNYYDDGYENITNYLVDPSSNKFLETKNNIINDFIDLKSNNPDLIIVMPHYGTQFSKKIDIYQETYNRLFVSLGANIILGDHAHAIQPIEYYGNSIIVNCPGNYINSFVKYDGDISAYIKIYVDKDKEVKAASITPIIAQKNENGVYYPTLLDDSNPYLERTKKIIGNVIFNQEIKETRQTYYYFKDKKYRYENKYSLKISTDDRNSKIYQEILQSNKICFIGDSITEGTKNNYHPWYEPLMSNFDNKEIVNISKGSFTTDDIIREFKDDIIKSHCDLSIINIGTNDIRYNVKNVDDYIENIKEILSYISGKKIVLSPWETTNNDYNIAKNDIKKRNLYNVYNRELSKINDIIYINPNPYIKEALSYNGEENYLIDGIHPNDNAGIKLYSYAVLRSK